MIDTFQSRNRIEIVDDGDTRFFKKWLIGDSSDIEKRINNIRLWANIASSCNFESTPKLLGIDSTEKSASFEFIEGKSLSVKYDLKNRKINDFDELETAMKLLSQVHGINYQEFDLLKSAFALEERGIGIVKHVPIGAFCMASGAELEFLRLAQNNRDLQFACSRIAILRRTSNNIVFSHGDFRPDQVMSSSSGYHIIDFEELCLAPQESDLGSFFGALLFAILQQTIVEHINNNSAVSNVKTSLTTVLSEVIESTIADLNKLLKIYVDIQSFRSISFEFLVLETAWSIFERVFSRAKLSFNLNNTDKAILGIAVEMLKSPEEIGFSTR